MAMTSTRKKPATSVRSRLAPNAYLKRLVECDQVIDEVVHQRELVYFAHELYHYISQLGIQKAKLKIVATRIDDAERELDNALGKLAVVQTVKSKTSTRTNDRGHKRSIQ